VKRKSFSSASLIFGFGQTVTRIPAATGVLNKNALFEQNANVPQGRIGGAFGEPGIF